MGLAANLNQSLGSLHHWMSMPVINNVAQEDRDISSLGAFYRHAYNGFNNASSDCLRAICKQTEFFVNDAPRSARRNNDASFFAPAAPLLGLAICFMGCVAAVVAGVGYGLCCGVRAAAINTEESAILADLLIVSVVQAVFLFGALPWFVALPAFCLFFKVVFDPWAIGERGHGYSGSGRCMWILGLGVDICLSLSPVEYFVLLLGLSLGFFLLEATIV